MPGPRVRSKWGQISRGHPISFAFVWRKPDTSAKV